MDVIVVGAGRIGSRFVELATEAGHEVVVIERDEEAAQETSLQHDCMVLEGDGASREVLEDAGIGKADAIVATTDVDSTNILAMMHGRDAGVPSLVSSVNDVENLRLFRELSVNVVESPHRLAGEYLYRAVHRPQIKDFMEVGDGAEIFEILASDHAPIAEYTLEEARKEGVLADAAIVVAVNRGGELIVPRGDTRIEPGDLVTVFSRTGTDRRTLDAFGAESVSR